MHFQRALLVLLAVAFLAPAQNKPATQSPDREAYKKAVLRKDARERMNALRKFVMDYPKSSRVDSANELILKTLVQNWPDQTGEIGDQVRVIARGRRGDDKMDEFDTVADILVTHGVLLETAEKLERQALDQFHEKRYKAKLKRELPSRSSSASAIVLALLCSPPWDESRWRAGTPKPVKISWGRPTSWIPKLARAGCAGRNRFAIWP
jgi:hypothetical protein